MFYSAKEALRVRFTGNEFVLLVDEATNDKPWGPTGQQMQAITDSFSRGSKDIITELHHRLKNRDKSWRICYKSLLVLHYLVRHVNISYLPVFLELLSLLKHISLNFFYTEKGVDHGISVRISAQKLIDLLTNSAMLNEERQRTITISKRLNEAKYNNSGSLYVGEIGRSDMTSRKGNMFHTQENDSGFMAGAHESDYELALRLQREEDIRGNRAKTYDFLRGREGVNVNGGTSQSSIRGKNHRSIRPFNFSPNATQEERDHALAQEIQYRLDTGLPIEDLLEYAATFTVLSTQTTEPLPHNSNDISNSSANILPKSEITHVAPNITSLSTSNELNVPKEQSEGQKTSSPSAPKAVKNSDTINNFNLDDLFCSSTAPLSSSKSGFSPDTHLDTLFDPVEGSDQNLAPLNSFPRTLFP